MHEQLGGPNAFQALRWGCSESPHMHGWVEEIQDGSSYQATGLKNRVRQSHHAGNQQFVKLEARARESGHYAISMIWRERGACRA